MDASDIISRLKSQCPALKQVGEAVAMDDAVARSLTRPAAFVFLAGEQAGENTAMNAHIQRITQTWAVAIAVNGIRSASSSLTADVNAVRVAIRAALCGWSPEDDVSPFIFSGGQLLARENNVIWWQDEFSCWTTYRLMP